MLISSAHCKVNLVLDVTARRKDGWHDIDSVLVPIDWHDLVGVSVHRSARAKATLRVSGDLAEQVPDDDGNLALRAAQALLRLAGEPVDIDVWVAKHVPVAAGLGGGSADAAAVFRSGAQQIAALGGRIDRRVLFREAMDAGSDVPALLAGGSQRVTGLGDVLLSVPVPRMHLAVAIAGQSSTAASFAALLPAEIGDSGRVERVVASLRADQLDEADFGSALEQGACRASPLLARSIETLRAATPGRRWHMTGTGGALFCVARHRGDAVQLAARAREHGLVARACRSLDG